ncbi:MAG: glycerol-3-phosphate 1-O-acyltransferase PlsY [Francisella sp.]
MNYLNFSMLIFAYFLGSINSAIIVCYVFGLPSPRSVGSGNPGATNVLRLGGKLPALITLIMDILKGLVPVIIAKALTYDDEFIVACVGLYAIIGHIFPIFFEFKGGKGVATLIGVLFGFNLILGLTFVITWLCVAAITRYSSLSALIATIVSTCLVMLKSEIDVSIVFVIISILVIIKHRGNIQRIIKGQESKIGDKAKVSHDSN